MPQGSVALIRVWVSIRTVLGWVESRGIKEGSAHITVFDTVAPPEIIRQLCYTGKRNLGYARNLRMCCSLDNLVSISGPNVSSRRENEEITIVSSKIVIQ